MSYKYASLVYEFLDGGDLSEERIRAFLAAYGAVDFTVNRVYAGEHFSDFIKIIVHGQNGALKGGTAKTLGVVGRLGGVGARPEVTGLVSDADGAIVALSTALKLLEMQKRNDYLNGDVVITTHICPCSPTIQHFPASFMKSPVPVNVENTNTIFDFMDAVISIDTTRGNRIINKRGIAITPTVKNGYILRIAEDILDIMSNVTGTLPVVLPLTMQDITPYDNGLYHINSIMQPATATNAPVLGVAITSETVIPGNSSGVTRLADIEEAVRLVIEIAKGYGTDKLSFYDENEFKILEKIYSFHGFLK